MIEGKKKKKYEITEEFVEGLTNYLLEQKAKEVINAIMKLQQLPEIKENKEEDKNA